MMISAIRITETQVLFEYQVKEENGARNPIRSKPALQKAEME